MSGGYLTKKTPIVGLLLLFVVVSLNAAEAGRTIRVRKVKTQIAPRHISLSARSGNGMYARTYAYGRPIPSYSTKAKLGSNRRYSPGRRRSGRRTYASRYRNWSPHAMKNPRADRIGQLKKRKELLPFLIEPAFGLKHKRRVRPHRLSAMQRPKPPKKPNEFDDEYFFPEEAKRAETKYEFESRYPRPKKKRRPEFESNYRNPDPVPKIPYYDEKPLGYKTKSRQPPFSYSSFIQHSSGSSDDPEDFYEDPDNVYSEPVVRNKKKRVKKKSNSRKKNKEQFKPFVFENDPAPDNYPPYVASDEYEPPSKTYKKRNKPTYDPDEDEFVPSKSYSKPRPQLNSLFSTDSDYRGTQNTQQVQFSPTYSQTWSHSSPVVTTARPPQYQTENGFQPQQYNPNQFNYNQDYSTVQKTKTVTTNTQHTYYSQPDNTYKTLAYSNNYATNQATHPHASNSYAPNSATNPASHSQTSNNYNTLPTNYNTFSTNYNNPSPTYSQPLPSSSSLLTDVTIQKSVPVYDNTETFYNFNNNAFVNSQSSKYYNTDSDTTYKYGTRLPTSSSPSSSSSSYRNKLNDKTDSDSDFMKKHQNLYHNGLSGVPVQGDGYAKESAKKDYDIGYGDFQFDENPNT